MVKPVVPETLRAAYAACIETLLANPAVLDEDGALFETTDGADKLVGTVARIATLELAEDPTRRQVRQQSVDRELGRSWRISFSTTR